MTFTEFLQILAGGVGSLGFGLLFNIRGRHLVVATIGGLLSWFLFVILHYLIPNDPICYFIVALLMSLYAEVMARIIKTPTTTFITTTLVPLIPGGSLYKTMASAFESNAESFLTRGIATLELAAALALGIIVAASLTKLILHKKPAGK